MSLADEARSFVRQRNQCKTCTLEESHDGLREEIAKAVGGGLPVRAISQALVSRYDDEAPSESALRSHVRDHL